MMGFSCSGGTTFQWKRTLVTTVWSVIVSFFPVSLALGQTADN